LIFTPSDSFSDSDASVGHQDLFGRSFVYKLHHSGEVVAFSLIFLSQAVVLMLVPTIAYAFGSAAGFFPAIFDPEVTFVMLIVGVMIVGCGTAVAYHSVLGWVALLPPKCTTSVMSGIGLRRSM
jgi:hypothetical protein